jgi:hypothetical protein
MTSLSIVSEGHLIWQEKEHATILVHTTDTTHHMSEEEKGWKYYLKLTLILIMIVAIVSITVGFLVPNSPIIQPLLSTIEWIQSQPLWLKCIFMLLLFLVALTFGVPSTPLELCSGFIFGFLLGSTVAMIGASKFYHYY